VHPTAPLARPDYMGLVPLLSRFCRVVALDEAGADLVTNTGARQRFYRRPLPWSGWPGRWSRRRLMLSRGQDGCASWRPMRRRSSDGTLAVTTGARRRHVQRAPGRERRAMGEANRRKAAGGKATQWRASNADLPRWVPPHPDLGVAACNHRRPGSQSSQISAHAW
jgi:hypothetical protein